MSRALRATVTVAATPDQVFELLTDPARHCEFDATGMVGIPATSAGLTHVGQIFVMNMTYRKGDYIEHYQSDNHVCALEPGRAIGWATATHGGAPLGWFWRYDVKPVADGADVTLTYDWASTGRAPHPKTSSDLAFRWWTPTGSPNHSGSSQGHVAPPGHQVDRWRILAAFSPRMASFSACERMGSDRTSSAVCVGSYHG